MTQEPDIIEFSHQLPHALHYTRLARHKSLRDVEAETGVSFRTVARVESRGSNNLETIRTLTRWIAAGDATMRAVR